jgi:hypothetical protein
MTRRRRFRYPAPGQMTFRFLLVWTPLEPPRPPPLPHGWWRKSRKAPERPPERPGEGDARTVNRWIKRRASCVLCGSWPAPCDHRIGSRLVLLCRDCNKKPDALARVREVISIEWAGSDQKASTY